MTLALNLLHTQTHFLRKWETASWNKMVGSNDKTGKQYFIAIIFLSMNDLIDNKEEVITLKTNK